MYFSRRAAGLCAEGSAICQNPPFRKLSGTCYYLSRPSIIVLIVLLEKVNEVLISVLHHLITYCCIYFFSLKPANL